MGEAGSWRKAGPGKTRPHASCATASPESFPLLHDRRFTVISLCAHGLGPTIAAGQARVLRARLTFRNALPEEGGGAIAVLRLPPR